MRKQVVGRPTVRGLARVANVSASTVSRALSGKEGVSEETRAQILRLAKEMGIDASAQPAGIGEGRATAALHRDTIAFEANRRVSITFLIDDRHNPYASDMKENPFLMELIAGLCTGSQSFGCALHVVTVESEVALDEMATLQTDGDKGEFRGVIWLGYLPREAYDPWLGTLTASGIPVVLCDHYVPGLPCDSVLSDNLGGSLTIARHIAAQGHRRVAILRQKLPSIASDQRTLGFRAGLLEGGVPSSEDIFVIDAAPSFEGGYEAADQIIESGCTAALCGNDVMALGVLRRANERAVAVPGELSVTGFDDISTSSRISPSLTTVRVDKHALGHEAIRRILIRMREREFTSPLQQAADDAGVASPIRSFVPTDLIVRESAGAPA